MKKVLFFAALLFVFASTVHAQETLADRLKKHVYTLAADSLQGRKAGTEFTRKAAEYIAQQLDETGIAPLNGESYYVPFQNGQFQNIVGVIHGSHPVLKDEYIVVGAHYDHLGTKGGAENNVTIYNGADDNASGTAVVIELGRLLKEIEPTLGRSVIIIAFDAEELGLFGSYHFVNYPPVPLEKVKLMFSIDMVGWYKKSGFLQYSGIGTFKSQEAIIMNSSLNPNKLNIKAQKFERFLLGATDTQGFAEKDIPTLYVTTGLKSPYHKPEDEADLIDYEGMALVTEHLRNVVQAFSKDETYHISGRISSKHKTPRFSLGITASTGSGHHYYTAGALDGKTSGAWSIGFSAGINMGVFGVRPELFYDYLQFRHPDGKIFTHSVTTPLNLLLQTRSSSSGGAAIFVGPYYSYRFCAKQGDSKLDFDHLYHRSEMGINWGLEFRISYLRLGITRRDAVTNFTRFRNEDEAHIRNRTFFVTLGYVF